MHSIFYGYSSELIAQWCAVSAATAGSWKAGRSKPTRQALKLFQLYAQEQVLTSEFRRFRIRKNILVDPQGLTFTVAQLEMYHMMLQAYGEAARSSKDPAVIERYYELLQQVG